MLHRFSQQADGRALLRERASELRQALRPGPHALLLLALASTLHALNEYERALEAAAAGLKLAPENTELAWWVELLARQVAFEQRNRAPVPAETARLFATPLPVARVAAAALSPADFHREFVAARRPVVLTGLTCTAVPWTLAHVAAVAADTQSECGAGRRFRPRIGHKHSVEWARLQDTGADTDMASFVRDVAASQRPHEYLFDISLPLYCPNLAREFIIPRFFANDFLRRTPVGSKYRDSWPSLFVCGAGLVSELHVDTFGSHFWMALLQGRKRWTFFRPEDTPKLYPRLLDSLDPLFDVDLAAPDFESFPWLAAAQPFVCELAAGEVLFVPAGCAHRVETLAPSVAVSGNFVDASNLATTVAELRAAGLRDPESARLADILTAPDFDTTMSWPSTDLLFADWKET